MDFIGAKITTNRLGEVRNNKFGTPMKIVEYRCADDIDVEFLDEYHYIKEHNTYSNFKSGGIRNPYDKTVLGMGYLGVGKHLTQDETQENSRVYMCWKHMIERCYIEKHKNLHQSYYGICTICDEWLNFQTFADWYTEREYEVNERLHLDKDIKNVGNTHYSPENCLLVPQRINELFTCRRNSSGLPTGVKPSGTGKYISCYNGKHLGTFFTIEDAFRKYAARKEEVIKEVANEYKEIIPKDVYDALINYKVLLENDKNYKVA